MSGILGQLLGSLGGGGANTSGLSTVLAQLLGGGTTAGVTPVGTPAGTPGATTAQSPTGGLSGLMAMLDQAGLGDKARSWVGTGENHPISPDQLASALPPAQVQGWAQQAGMPVETLMASLAHVLPTAVDHATPEGTVPATGAPPPSFDVAGIVGRMFGNKTA